MNNPNYETLERLGKRVSRDPNVLCLLGLGSMSELHRMDQFSDIDFFLIVEEGTKRRFLESLDWLEVETIVYRFANTNDGYKILFANGVYAEFAIFEPMELRQATFVKGRIVYRREDFNPILAEPVAPPAPRSVDIHHVVNEALTNLYVGLQRERRGETASAFLFIQVYAATSIMHTFPTLFQETANDIDPFGIDRRIEFRFQEASAILSKIRQGTIRNVASASEALCFLQSHFPINQAMAEAIRQLLD